jgi:Holliday junction resolvase RusA-like endonuclease
MSVVVTIPGPPGAQKRHRHMRYGKGKTKIRTYDPSEDEKKPIKWFLAAAMAGKQPFEGPLRLRVLAVFELPSSRHKKRDPVAEQWHDVRPDADNVAKLLMDAAPGIVYHNDTQVAELHVRKVFAAQGRPSYVRMWIDPLPRFRRTISEKR